MKLLNDSSKLPKWMLKLAAAVAPRNEAERRAQHVTAYILILVAAVALFIDAIT